MRNVATEAEEFGKDDIKDSEHQKRTKERPEVAEDGALIAKLKISFRELFEEDTITLVPDTGDVHTFLL